MDISRLLIVVIGQLFEAKECATAIVLSTDAVRDVMMPYVLTPEVCRSTGSAPRGHVARAGG